MNKENGLKITLWLKPDIAHRVDGWLEENNYKSHGEFAEKALRSYMGYLTTEDASEYLSHAPVGTLRGTLADNKNRLYTLLFKLCMEVNMIGHTVAARFRADPMDRRELRAYAMDKMLRTNGKIRFDDALDLQHQIFPGGEWVVSGSCPPTWGVEGTQPSYPTGPVASPPTPVWKYSGVNNKTSLL